MCMRRAVTYRWNLHTLKYRHSIRAPKWRLTFEKLRNDRKCATQIVLVSIHTNLPICCRDTKTGLTTPRVHAKRMTDESAAAEKKDNWRPWKRKDVDNMSGSKLLIPLPIPHPANIAIAIHNRDSEQPIPMDSELCWDILRAIEDCQGDVKVCIMDRREVHRV